MLVVSPCGKIKLKCPVLLKWVKILKKKFAITKKDHKYITSENQMNWTNAVY